MDVELSGQRWNLLGKQIYLHPNSIHMMKKGFKNKAKHQKNVCQEQSLHVKVQVRYQSKKKKSYKLEFNQRLTPFMSLKN